MNFGTLLFAVCEFDKTEQIQEQAYDKRRFGEGVIGDKEFVVAGFDLALTKEELGKKSEVLRFIRDTLRLSREAFGHVDLTTLRIPNTLTEWSETFRKV